ncbi:metal-dependent hydrolase [Brassicibacter mesophilus]|uniref:metal-dependent hydrolase n=1 Tax=Brassicibacter mesophilus TaxID=745119 RepID=UPI003D202D1E
MLIAHAPAGYVVLRLFNKIKKENISYFKYGILFSIWPDFDLLYFYLIDNKSSLHHFYFPHIPLFAFICCFLVIVLKKLKVDKRAINIYYLFLINWFIHLALDTVTGGINWLYPINNKLFVFIKIPANYQHWIISFVLHWSFLFEISIVIWAVILFLKRKNLRHIKREGDFIGNKGNRSKVSLK